MSAGIAPIFPAVVQTSAVAILPADTTAEKTLVTAGTNGARIDTVSVVSTDTAARTFTVLLNDGSTSYPVGEVVVPITAGSDGATLAVKALALAFLPWLDASGSLFLKAGWKLNVAAKVAVTTAKAVTFVACYGDF